MNFESYIFPAAIVSFFAYRAFKGHQIRKKLPELMKSGAVIIDVRTSGEYAQGHNPNSVNIPLDQLASKSANLDKDKTYVLCCASGARSAAAVGILKSKGFKNVMNAGSWPSTILKQ